jgi:hypothetical protein
MGSGDAMVIFFVTRPHHYTLAEAVAAAPPGSVEAIYYDRAIVRKELPRVTYVFSDLDRLNPQQLKQAAELRRQLVQAGCRVLNDPAVFVGRLALLRKLYAAGINRFTAYPAVPTPSPERWPVFLRREAGHRGPGRELIADPAKLAEWTAAALAVGVPPEQLIVVEFSAEPLACGLWRKLSVWRVGDRLFSDSCVHDRSWIAKIGEEGIAPADVYADELRLMRENPYGQEMLRVFELAGVEYGRVDFGLVSGRPTVWEINTNPLVEFLPETPSPFRNETRRLFRDHYLTALAALDSPPER